MKKEAMGATILKLSEIEKKPLTEKQKRLMKKLLNGPVMSDEQYKEYLKTNKWMRKWKV